MIAEKMKALVAGSSVIRAMFEEGKKMAQEVLSGKRKGTPDTANGLNRSIHDFGVTIRYSDPDALK